MRIYTDESLHCQRLCGADFVIQQVMGFFVMYMIVSTHALELEEIKVAL